MQRGVFRGILDEQQRAIFRQIWEGKSSRAAAAAIGTSPEEFERIVRRTCQQLGTRSRREAALIIATHNCWGPPAIAGQRPHSSQHIGHFGANIGQLSTRMDETEREQPNRSSYVRDADNDHPAGTEAAGTFDESVRLLDRSKIFDAPVYVQRILLLVLIIIGSALTLSALVSAMQGFDRLMSS
jgi:hypothetical protein